MRNSILCDTATATHAPYWKRHETCSGGQNDHAACSDTSTDLRATDHAKNSDYSRVLLLSPGTSGNVHLCQVWKTNLCLLHETLRAADDLPAMLLDSCTPHEYETARSLKTFPTRDGLSSSVSPWSALPHRLIARDPLKLG
jgi:hypothetical protein